MKKLIAYWNLDKKAINNITTADPSWQECVMFLFENDQWGGEAFTETNKLTKWVVGSEVDKNSLSVHDSVLGHSKFWEDMRLALVDGKLGQPTEGEVSGCLAQAYELTKTCTCDLYAMMNYGCPSTKGLACARRKGR